MHALAALLALGCSAQPSDRPYALMVGDPAPALTVKEWIKGDPVTALDQGRVTLLEFWATWCGPCREGMPHLTELQQKYKDKLTIIGVNAWEPDQSEARPFVEKNAARMGYTVAMDDVPEPPPELAAEAKNHSRWATQNGRMSLGWMKASGWMDSGIPCAFIVDGRGRVAWMGNPASTAPGEPGMGEVLAAVIAGTWDLEREAAAYRARMVTEVKARAIWKEVSRARRAKEWPAALKACDEGLALGPAHAGFAATKFNTLLDMHDHAAALAFAREAVAGVARDHWPTLGDIAYALVYPREGQPRPDPASLDLALAAAQRAEAITGGERPYVLDTLARAHFLKGDARKAAEIQARALTLAHSDQMRDQYRARLDEYQRAAAGR